MDSSATTSAPTATDKAASSPLPGASTTDNTDNSSRDGNNLEFDPSLSEEERRFYLKAYPSVDLVRERKVHCTICKIHIGTAPAQESVIKMHPILRVTHCTKCHDFYNSGEFSKGEDGSELYCRWCGQGGEVYCCSNCPYVFCKSCIVKNLSRGVVADIEQNENWSCFSCAPKILWPLRAQHWALINYIDKQKKSIKTMNLSDSEERTLTAQDRSTCCRLAKAKCGNMSDSLESLDSAASKRSIGSINVASGKKTFQKQSPVPGHSPVAKRVKTSNDEVVCTPDLLSMLEPDCQITVSQKPRPVQAPLNSTPKVLSIQSSYGAQQTPKSSLPPPLVLRNTGIQMRPVTPGSIVRRTVIGPRTPTPGSTTTPVYHTINGYRIDLNSAAQQETFRLPNGKLIQVKRQGAQQQQLQQHQLSNINSWQQRTPATIQQHARPVQITQASPQSQYQTITIQPNSNNSHQMSHSQQSPMVRYHNTMVGSTTVTSVGHNGPQIQVLNGTPPAPVQNAAPTTTATVRPVMVRHVFPDNPIGQARSQLQEQVFNAMEICQHLTGKVQTLTNSNAYKQARNYLEVKELYIHLSYLLTYAIGRFKGLQDKCLGDMRLLGFVNDADSLENGQLAAGVDYVRYGQLDDVDLFNTGSNSFHNQVYEYRKSLHANLESDENGEKEPLSPLMPLGGCGDIDAEEDADGTNDDDGDDNSRIDNDWKLKPVKLERYNDSLKQDCDDNDEPDESYMDDEQQDETMEAEEDDEGSYSRHGFGLADSSKHRSTEDYMSREEESHAYDRKLTRLIEQYPSIWCTRHPDYGNFEVTRKQWRAIASHFNSNESIKLRWKNIRKRYVRIERRIAEGKRFSGYFDKATNFLSNRSLPVEQWLPIDCGESDGDVYDRKQLDAVERTLQSNKRAIDDTNDFDLSRLSCDEQKHPVKPIEIRSLDLKIINFVKCNPILWRKSGDPATIKAEEQTRRSLWMHLWKSVPSLHCEDIIDRWVHLYEMYKTFRLKTIKDPNTLANLELKYSKYLAKLYFLYKIDEEDLKNENCTYDECGELEDPPEECTKLQQMPDDKEFVLQLVRVMNHYPSLWDKFHIDYNDNVLREQYWHDIAEGLKEFKRDVNAIKIRWQLAKFCYSRLRRDRHNNSSDGLIYRYSKNLPVDEMKFL